MLKLTKLVVRRGRRRMVCFLASMVFAAGGCAPSVEYGGGGDEVAQAESSDDAPPFEAPAEPASEPPAEEVPPPPEPGDGTPPSLPWQSEKSGEAASEEAQKFFGGVAASDEPPWASEVGDRYADAANEPANADGADDESYYELLQRSLGVEESTPEAVATTQPPQQSEPPEQSEPVQRSEPPQPDRTIAPALPSVANVLDAPPDPAVIEFPPERASPTPAPALPAPSIVGQSREAQSREAQSQEAQSPGSTRYDDLDGLDGLQVGPLPTPRRGLAEAEVAPEPLADVAPAADDALAADDGGLPPPNEAAPVATRTTLPWDAPPAEKPRSGALAMPEPAPERPSRYPDPFDDPATASVANGPAEPTIGDQPVLPPVSSRPVSPPPVESVASEPVASEPVAETPPPPTPLPPAPQPLAKPREPVEEPRVAMVEPSPLPAIPTVAYHTEHLAWLLGGKLGLMVAPDATTAERREWSQAIRRLTDTLGVPEPAPPPPRGSVTRRLGQALQSARGLGDRLVAEHGSRHSALMEIAFKSQALVAVYDERPDLAGPVARSIVAAAERANLTNGLWRKPVSQIEQAETIEEVSDAVDKIYTAVEVYLNGSRG